MALFTPLVKWKDWNIVGFLEVGKYLLKDSYKYETAGNLHIMKLYVEMRTHFRVCHRWAGFVPMHVPHRFSYEKSAKNGWLRFKWIQEFGTQMLIGKPFSAPNVDRWLSCLCYCCGKHCTNSLKINQLCRLSQCLLPLIIRQVKLIIDGNCWRMEESERGKLAIS